MSKAKLFLCQNFIFINMFTQSVINNLFKNFWKVGEYRNRPVIRGIFSPLFWIRVWLQKVLVCQERNRYSTLYLLYMLGERKCNLHWNSISLLIFHHSHRNPFFLMILLYSPPRKLKYILYLLWFSAVTSIAVNSIHLNDICVVIIKR